MTSRVCGRVTSMVRLYEARALPPSLTQFTSLELSRARVVACHTDRLTDNPPSLASALCPANLLVPPSPIQLDREQTPQQVVSLAHPPLRSIALASVGQGDHLPPQPIARKPYLPSFRPFSIRSARGRARPGTLCRLTPAAAWRLLHPGDRREPTPSNGTAFPGSADFRPPATLFDWTAPHAARRFRRNLK